MTTITTRSGKGSPLTNNEVDANFTNLNSDKYESGDSASFSAVTVDNITIDGSEIDVSSGDLTLDVAGDIILDAAGDDIIFKTGGVEFGSIFYTNSNLYLNSSISNGDIVFRGNDDGSAINALVLDMSAAGAATFNSDIYVPTKIRHVGDTDTYLTFADADDFRIVVGNSTRAAFNTSKIHFNQEGTDQDFQVQSDNDTHMLFVDAGNNRVGIGTSSPSNKLSIVDSGATTLEINGQGRASSLTLGVTASESKLFEGSNNALAFGTAGTERMRITSAGDVEVKGGNELRVYRTDNATYGSIEYLTGAGGLKLRDVNGDGMTFSGASSDYIRIDSSGLVGIGNSSASSFTGASAQNLVVGSGSGHAGMTVYSGTTSVGGLAFADGTSAGSHYRGLVQYRHSEDAMLLYASETERMRIGSSEAVVNENSNDYDFRVESDSKSHMLFVDAGNDRVGVAESSPDALLHINATSNGNFQEAIRLTNAGGGSNEGAFIRFEVANTDGHGALIGARRSGFGGVDLRFDTGEISGAPVTAMTIDHDQNVGIGVGAGSISSLLHVGGNILSESSSTLNTTIRATGNNTRAIGNYQAHDSSGNDVNMVMGVFGDASRGEISTNTNHTLRFYVNNTPSKYLEIATTGQVFTSHGMVINEDSHDSDFRVESNNFGHVLFVDASADKVGINDSSPSHLLTVKSDHATNPAIKIEQTGNTDGWGFVANNNEGYLEFQRIGGGVEGTHLSITNAGNVGMGVSNGDVRSDGNASRTYVGIIGSGNRGVLNIGSTAANGADGGAISFVNGANELGALYNDAASGSQTSGTMYLTSTGALDFRGAGGAVFNEHSLDADFRVESNNNANMFFVDAGNDVVVIGGTTAETADTFEVISSDTKTNVRIRNTNAGATGPVLIFDKHSPSAAQDDDIGDIRFIGLDSAGNAEQYARLHVQSGNITSGAEDGVATFNMMVNGYDTNMYTMNHVGTVFNEGGDSDLDFRVENGTLSHAFYVSGSNSANIVGINQSNPAAMLDIVTVMTAGADAIRLRQPSSSETYQIQLGQSGVTNDGLVFRSTASTGLLQQWNANEVVINDDGVDRDFRVESDGNANMIFVDGGNNRVLIGTNSATAVSSTCNTMHVAGGSSDAVTPVMMISDADGSVEGSSTILECLFSGDNTFGSAFYVKFTDSGGTQGSISGTGDGTVTYNTSSDERLKQSIQDTDSKWDLVKSLQVRDYEWKKSGKKEIGFIAQELHEKWAQPVKVGGEDVKIDPWSVDYGKLTPILTKALQEAMEKIEALEAKITALEAN